VNSPATAEGLRILHAIHDFLPRHRAGSEIYAFDLCQELDRRHHITILAAEYDGARAHGRLTWRVQDGLAVVEIVNNWVAESFEDTYRSRAIADRLGHVLDMVQPDVLHVHSLLNLSFDLPGMAHARGIPVAATLHDYTLVCPSGGQRVHRAEDHVCATIDVERCARCFTESPQHAQIGVARLARGPAASALASQAARFLLRRAPGLAARAAGVARRAAVTVDARAIGARLDRAREVFDQVDLFVAPSRSLGDEFVRLGVDPAKLRVIDHGFAPVAPGDGQPTCSGRAVTDDTRLRIGYVGTLVWHKGVHLLIDAVRDLPADAYELRIFGDPAVAPDYSADLRSGAAGLPVRFMGEFDRARIGEAYGSLDVLVIPSIWPENSPLVVREAFMAGVPVVGARSGGIPELVTHDLNGLLYEPRSTTDLTRTLRRLVDDCALVRRLARNIPPVKSMTAHACEWESIYAELLQR
jgi:glycosyltransferase involved in cell wall biosynthesis